MVKPAFALLALQLVIVACSSPLPEPTSEYDVSTLVDPRGEPIRFKRPEGLAVDLNSNLYVVEALGGIWRVSPEGVASNLVAGEALSLPAKIALGDDDALYITESAANRVRLMRWTITGRIFKIVISKAI